MSLSVPESQNSTEDLSSISSSSRIFESTNVSNNIRTLPSTGTKYFTFRALVVGLSIGVLNCICNAYFILQAGWGTDLSMSSSLIGFAIFRTRLFAGHPSTVAETVFIQTVASTTGMMILSVGFAGVFPALEFLLRPEEGAPINLDLGRLVLWGLGICLVGSTFSGFLRKQMVLKEKLKYPTGTATAALISILHQAPNKHALDDSYVMTSAGEENLSLADSYSAASDGDSVISLELNADHRSISAEQTEDLSQTYIWYLTIALIVSALFVSFTLRFVRATNS